MRAPKLTRRGLFKAAAATTVAAGAVAVSVSAAGCSNTPADPTPEPTVVDEDSATNILKAFTDASGEKTFEPEATWTLPLGCVLHPAEGSWIPVTAAGSSATPMVKGEVLSLATGTLTEVVPKPLGAATTTVIYDARCSDEAYAWLELDHTTRDWTLYASAFKDGQLTGDTKTLWQGTKDFDPAPFDVSGNAVVWQVQPSLGGSKTTQSSYCYLWRLGSSDAKAVVESQGRFATRLTVSDGVCVLAPRVRNSEGTYYGVTAYSIDDDFGTKIDQLVMPKSVKPFKACRVGDRFMLSVEASYSSGGLLGKMGTYIGSASAGWARMDREPSEIGCGKDDIFVIKDRSYYFMVDLANKTYATLGSADRSLDYGEYPARVGAADLLVTFSTVKDATTGYPAAVTVRTFRL